MAAPHVSGGIALLQITLKDSLVIQKYFNVYFLRPINLEFIQISEIYGQGLMDLDAATKPVGTAMIATSGSNLSNLNLAEEGSYVGIVGPAFGNSISTNLSQLSYVVFDELEPLSKIF